MGVFRFLGSWTKNAGTIETAVIAAIYIKPKLNPKKSTMYPKIMLENEAIVKPMVKYNPNI
jgi:hypothetical protein